MNSVSAILLMHQNLQLDHTNKFTSIKFPALYSNKPKIKKIKLLIVSI